MEGTAILASDRGERLAGALGRQALRRAAAFSRRISVVDEALLAFGTGMVTAMHDPTEGGVANGVHEIADASGKGFRIFEEKIPIAAVTMAICGHFRIDPLRLIASGSLLIASKRGASGAVVETLRKNRIPASVVGEVLSSPRERIIVRKEGGEEELCRPASDHLWLALGR
jgi:hydrogenase maturation factor